MFKEFRSLEIINRLVGNGHRNSKCKKRRYSDSGRPLNTHRACSICLANMSCSLNHHQSSEREKHNSKKPATGIQQDFWRPKFGQLAHLAGDLTVGARRGVPSKQSCHPGTVQVQCLFLGGQIGFLPARPRNVGWNIRAGLPSRSLCVWSCERAARAAGKNWAGCDLCASDASSIGRFGFRFHVNHRNDKLAVERPREM